MTQNDFDAFSDLWISANAVSSSNKTPSADAVSMVFEMLADYELSDIRAALIKHAKASRFAPTPADIVEIIDSRKRCKHIGADEAWAIVLDSFDETKTVVWTQEIFEAKAIAQTIWETGDETGARLAFREAYNRIISGSDREPVWIVTTGWNKEHREQVVTQAVIAGRLPRGTEQKYLNKKPETSFAALVDMSAKHVVDDPAEIKRRCSMIKNMLNGCAVSDAMSEREKIRQHEAEKKDQMLRKVYEMLGELH